MDGLFSLPQAKKGGRMNQMEQTARILAELEGFTWEWVKSNGFESEWLGKALSLITQLVGQAGVKALKEGAKLRVQHSGLSFIHGEYETVRCVPLR